MKIPALSLFFLLSFFYVKAQNTPSAKQVSNVSSFAKLYGYVRYFHPADEAAEIDWDRFVNYGVQQVESAANEVELKNKLNELFSPIAPSVKIFLTEDKLQLDKKSITPTNIDNYQPVAWQHLGLGTYSPLYKSIRTNREAKVFDNISNAFGPASSTLDLKPYRGRMFRMNASMKADVTVGKGQLWARIDLNDKKIGFFDNMDDRPVTDNSWRKYEIKGKIDTNATVLYFGAFLVGDGKIWIDDFKIEIDSNGKWIPLKLKNPSFEADNNKSEGWSATSVGYQAKVTKDVETIPEGRNVLSIERVQKTEMAKPLFKEVPTFGEYFVKDLGNNISCIVPLTLMGTKSNTFPVADSDKLAALKSKISLLSTNKIDKYLALSGVIVTWNVFQHFFPYKEENGNNWERQLSPSLTAAYAVKSPTDYSSVLKKLTEKLNDGHVSVYDNATNYFTIQADPLFVGGKFILNKVDPSAASRGLKVGDEIISINRILTLEKFEKLKAEISGSEQWKNTIAQAGLFHGEKDSQIVLSVRSKDQTLKTVDLKRSSYRQTIDTVTIKKLKDDVYYINIGNTEMTMIDKMMPDLAKAKGIVCDLRGYPKGNHDLISHLLKEKDNNKWMFVPKIVNPDYQKVTYDPSGWDMRPKQPHISAKIVFITGGYTISYAESYMGFIKQYKLATIIGQPTAGANGNVNTFDVPGNYKVRFTGMKITLQDGKQLFKLGIQPDIIVNPTIKGVSEGRDEQLEKAISLLE